MWSVAARQSCSGSSFERAVALAVSTVADGVFASRVTQGVGLWPVSCSQRWIWCESPRTAFVISRVLCMLLAHSHTFAAFVSRLLAAANSSTQTLEQLLVSAMIHSEYYSPSIRHRLLNLSPTDIPKWSLMGALRAQVPPLRQRVIYSSEGTANKSKWYAISATVWCWLLSLFAGS